MQASASTRAWPRTLSRGRRWRHALTVLAAAALIAGSAAGAASAGSAPPRPMAAAATGAAAHPHWRYRTYPKTPRRGGTTAARRGASTNPGCPGCTPPLLFTANSPVMGGLTATPGEATITPIFWAPSGYDFSASYKSLVERYIADVAAASGTTGNVFSVAEEYFQQLGSNPDQFIHYIVHAAPAVTVNAAYPAQSPANGNGCQATTGPPPESATYSACVSDSGLQTQLASTISANHLTAGDSQLFAVFFPPGVETCSGPNSGVENSTNNPCSNADYCGYHSEFGSSVPTIYANMPYADLQGCSDSWDGPQEPNGNAFADAEISILSHEASESITDAGGAWSDSSGNEDGDECLQVFGTPLGSTTVTNDGFGAGTSYNQVINGHDYYTQDEFSNADYAKNVGDLNSPSTAVPGSDTQVLGCGQRQDSVPGPPVGMSVAAGDATATVSWSAPTNAGGSALTGYTVTPSPGGPPQTVAAGVTTANFPGLSDGTAYTFTVTAANSFGNSPGTSASGMPVAPAGPGSFVGVTPARIMDTRSNLGAPGPVLAGHTVTLTVAGHGGVPSTGASAVVLNVTAVRPSAAGDVTVFPAGQARPASSNLNFVKDQTIPNLVVVPLGTGASAGMVSFYAAVANVQLIADVAGYYRSGTVSAPGAFQGLTPARIMDTRSNLGAPGPVLAGHTVTLSVAGHGGVPSTGASAVVLNVTAVRPSGSGFVTVFPAGVTRPGSSSLNLAKGVTIPNLVVVRLGTGGSAGKVSFYAGGASVQLIADVAGYYLAGTPTASGTFVGLTPARIMDTRSNQGADGPVPAGGTITLTVEGHGGLPSAFGSLVLNVTVVAPSAPGDVTVYPAGLARPTASNLNFVKGQIIPNLVEVPVGTGGSAGKVSFYAAGASLQLLGDVAGYYLP